MEFATRHKAASAARKQLGASWFDLAKIEENDGKWTIQLSQPISTEINSALTQEIEGAWNFPKAENQQQQASAAMAFFNSWQGPAAPVIAPETEESELSDSEIAEEQAAADQKADEEQASFTTQHNGKPWRKFSVVMRPTKLVWVIADMMNEDAEKQGKPAPTRKEVQDACVHLHGIASGTARTQYQHWKKARDEDRANQRYAAELSDKLNKSAE